MAAKIEKRAEGPPATRRRGRALETAILRAAWDDLIRVGYSELTLESVAASAQTSRTVLRRRWADRAELARAAVGHYVKTHPISIRESGDLREEMISFLRAFIERATPMMLLGTGQMAEYYREEHSSPADLRSAVMGDHDCLGAILGRAVARGEIDAEKLTPRISTLPVDLLRHDLMIRLAPPSDEAIQDVVDNIFLPLVTRCP